jgi:hypothetical protein
MTVSPMDARRSGPTAAPFHGSGTHVPPPQSSVQIHVPVFGSQLQTDGVQPTFASQICPSGQPLSWQPSGLGVSHPLMPSGTQLPAQSSVHTQPLSVQSQLLD